jgi:putative endonuclease
MVALWLEQRGYSIVATNLRIGHLEIDIVARQGPVVVIVEVRTRGEGAWTTPFGSIDPAKRTRLRRAGERLWQRRYKHDASVERMRFDVVSVKLVDGKPQIEHALAAF